MRIVEVSGIKLEIDERTARSIDQYKVGDKVKVLIKEYGDTYAICPGVIVGFSDFKDLPTIEVMYVKGESYEGDIFKMANINAKSVGVEICPFNELEVFLDKQNIIQKFDTFIAKRTAELELMQYKRQFFIDRFATAFETDKEQA